MRPPDDRGSAPIQLVQIRTGSPSVKLTRAEFTERFRERFADPAYAELAAELDALEATAWAAYDDGRKAPRTRAAGEGFADPTYELSVDWLAARAAIHTAQALHAQPGPARILVVIGGARNEHTCPGEQSKSQRLATEAGDALRERGCHVDVLDLSRLTAEYGLVIYPCKACVSTAMPLCHWPCSCYPNHGLGQVNDWMNDIYPRWVGAHGILIVTPTYWHQAPATLKLMMDRLVCADGGNPDPTSTHGKDPAKAKAIELAGWGYPRHLSGRAFALVVHGDTHGVEPVRRALHDWLCDMDLEPAGARAELDRMIGYYRPYATSHDDLDADGALVEEVRGAARILAGRVAQLRRDPTRPGDDEPEPRAK